jgi:hypothetical protein
MGGLDSAPMASRLLCYFRQRVSISLQRRQARAVHHSAARAIERSVGPSTRKIPVCYRRVNRVWARSRSVLTKTCQTFFHCYSFQIGVNVAFAYCVRFVGRLVELFDLNFAMIELKRLCAPVHRRSSLGPDRD